MIISRTPVRVSFTGGGTDLKEFYKNRQGSIVSSTIDKYIYVAVNRNFTDHLRVGYSKTEYAEKVDEIQHNLVRESLKLVGLDKGINVVYTSEQLLPDHEGSGLGASSSILVGTLHALHAFKGEYVSSEQLAREACYIEIDVLKHPIGKQDQYACAYGGFNHLKFYPDETVHANPVITPPGTLSKLNRRLLMFYTNLKKRSDEILTEQKENTEDNLESLAKMTMLSDNLLCELREGRLDNFGEILHEGWLLKQKLASKITNTQIEDYYERAREAGAIGGKITGSGGGGFLLLYCPEKYQDRVRDSLINLRELKFNFEQEGSKIVYVK